MLPFRSSPVGHRSRPCVIIPSPEVTPLLIKAGHFYHIASAVHPAENSIHSPAPALIDHTLIKGLGTFITTSGQKELLCAVETCAQSYWV